MDTWYSVWGKKLAIYSKAPNFNCLQFFWVIKTLHYALFVGRICVWWGITLSCNVQIRAIRLKLFPLIMSHLCCRLEFILLHFTFALSRNQEWIAKVFWDWSRKIFPVFLSCVWFPHTISSLHHHPFIGIPHSFICMMELNPHAFYFLRESPKIPSPPGFLLLSH